MFKQSLKGIPFLKRRALVFSCLLFLTIDRVGAVDVGHHAALTIDMFSNVDGGIETGTSVLGLLDLGLDVKVSDKTGFYANVYAIGGENPSDNVGDFNLLINTAALDAVRLYRAFIYTEFAGAEIHVGKVAVDDEFMVSDYASLFINSGFGIIPTVSGNIPIPNYPLSAPGVFFRKSLSESFCLQAGIYDGNTRSQRANKNGLNNALRTEEGLAMFVETTLNAGNSIIKGGGFVHSGELQDFSTGGVEDGNAGFYVSIDRTFDSGLFNRAGGWFARASYSLNNEVNIIDFYADAGVTFDVPRQQRSGDTLGFAVSYSGFGSDYINAQRASGTIQSNEEVVLEAIYNMEVTNNISLIPDVQYIINPANATEDATVLGIRLELQLPD